MSAMKARVQKKKLKPFPAVLRPRHRYLELELRGGPFRRIDVEESLWKTVIEAIGAVGAARADFAVMSVDDHAKNGVQKGILRADSTMLDRVRGAVCFLKTAGSAPCIARVSRVSGTLANLRKTDGLNTEIE
ncbi:hypothetical protein HY546_02390 [archaeon]|nr:hypothetical protein [archaeon]